MTRTVALLALALLCAAPVAFAEPALDPTLAPGDGQVEVRAHFGVATSPFDVKALPEAKGQAFVLSAGGEYALSKRLCLTLQAPLVLGSVAQPAGSYLDVAALGNPQLGARYSLLAPSSNRASLGVTGMVEVGAPLASHAANLLPNRVLAVADGIEGRGHPEWFTPGVVPIAASGALRWASSRWSLETELRLPMLVRVSQAHLPRATTNTRSVGLATLLGVEARYRLSRRLSLAAAAHLLFDALPVTEHVRDVSPVQDYERLSLFVHFGLRGALVVDLQTAVAGELGGTMLAGGLRAAVNFR